MRRLILLTSVACCAPALAQTADQSDIVVTAKRLDDARNDILPSLGESEFNFDRTLLNNQVGGADRNLTTWSGAFGNGGDVGFYGGSNGTIQPSATLHGSTGNTTTSFRAAIFRTISASKSDRHA